MDNDKEGEPHVSSHEEAVQPDSRTSMSVERRKRKARKGNVRDAQAERVDPHL